ncbi:MAG: TIM barrel protein [Planctomycetes bacterium]|nr:TIM barrel protein [Planctomycetota bacterium]
MKLCDDLHELSDELMLFFSQLGVECVKVSGALLMPPEGCGVVPKDDLRRLQDRLARHGLTLDCFLLPQGPETQYWNARFGRPERDREIEDVCRTLEVCGECGIPVVEWTWSIVDVWGSASGEWGRGGARVRRFDYERVKDTPPEPGWGVGADEMWERLEYFLRRIVPAAERAGVRLALHHQDPPTRWLKGEARILSDFAGMKRVLEMVPSPANGLNFCQGTVAEQSGADVIGMIRYFGERDKINHVHFRNVRGSVPQFDESFIDDGDVDMLEAMRAYHEVGYRYALMPDHWPHVVGDTRLGHRSRAYALGHIKALMQAVGAKPRGNRRMGEWANGRTSEWANKRMGEQANRRTSEWANKRMSE